MVCRLLRIFLILLAGVAVAQQSATSAPANPAPDTATSAPDQTKPAEATAGAQQYAHLHVYRQRRYAGSALSPSIYVDEKQVARVGNGRRVTVKLTPGAHSVRSDDKSSAISLDAKPGSEYFVRIDEEAGFFKGHGKLTMLLPEQGRAEYKLQKPIEEDRKTAKDLIEDDSDVADLKTR
jgi:hypothetical protein